MGCLKRHINKCTEVLPFLTLVKELLYMVLLHAQPLLVCYVRLILFMLKALPVNKKRQYFLSLHSCTHTGYTIRLVRPS
jgi:hypothetical protein